MLNVSTAPQPLRVKPHRQNIYGDGRAALFLYHGAHARRARDTPESWMGSRHSRRIGLRRVLGSFLGFPADAFSKNSSCN